MREALVFFPVSSPTVLRSSLPPAMAGGEGDPSSPRLLAEAAPSSQIPPRRTFAQALLDSKQRPRVSIPVKEPGFTDRGEPAVFFSKSDVQVSIQFLSFALVAKCSYGRPAFVDIKSSIMQRLKISADFIISKLNPRHLLLRFESEADFMKLLLQKNLYIRGFLFRFFRWTPDFNFDADPPTVPVWIGFPALPANLYHEDCLRSIAGNFGAVLRIHDKTLSLADTSEALVCVEMDLQAQRSERIWIDLDGVGFWQKVNFNRAPSLCSFCHKLGHVVEDCKKKMGRSTNDTLRQEPFAKRPRQDSRPRQEAPQGVRQYVPLKNSFEQLQHLEDLVDDQPFGGSSSVVEQYQRGETSKAVVEDNVLHHVSDEQFAGCPASSLCKEVDSSGSGICHDTNSVDGFRPEEEILLADSGDPVVVIPYDISLAGKKISEAALKENALMPLVGQSDKENMVGKTFEVGVLTRSRARSMEELPLVIQ